MTADFQRTLATLDPQVRKLLARLRVEAASDLKRIDPWQLTREHGVGRQTVRALLVLMRTFGVEPVARRPPSRSRSLVVTVPPSLVRQIEAVSEGEGLRPSQWILSTIKIALARKLK